MFTISYLWQMNFVALLSLAVALAMDAMAASVACNARNGNTQSQLQRMAILFGIFQAGMLCAGWILGKWAGSFGANWLQAIDHWIAFALLAIIGITMTLEGMHPADEQACHTLTLSWKRLIGLSFATSIDAAAVGLGFGLLDSPIVWESAIVGIFTYALSWIGGRFGNKLGARFGKWAEVAGGITLILIGANIALQHTIQSTSF